MKPPHVSIVIAAYATERYSYILKAIDSISMQTYVNFEIILVIDGNEELYSILTNTLKKKEDVKLRILKNEIRGGPSVARNKGVLESKGEIIAIIDDDVFVSPDWLNNILKNFDDENVWMVGGKILPLYENGSYILPQEILWTVGCTYDGHPVNRQTVRNIISANMAFRKKIFDFINFERLSNDKYWRMSDTLIGIRVNEFKPGSVIYDPSPIVYHNVPKKRTTLPYLIKRSYTEGFLKSKINKITKTNNVYNFESNYLKSLLSSIIKYIITFHIKYAFINLIVLMSVFIGFFIGFFMRGVDIARK